MNNQYFGLKYVLLLIVSSLCPTMSRDPELAQKNAMELNHLHSAINHWRNASYTIQLSPTQGHHS